MAVRKNVQTALGEGTLDSSGAPVTVARMDAGKAYKGIDLLLQRVIRDRDNEAWADIKRKIDYIYEHLDIALSSLEKETRFTSEIWKRLREGRKILFKPNLVSSENIDPYTYGPTPGSTANTEWPFVAAVLRWFHDTAGISYYNMCVGEAATAMSAVAAHYSHIKNSGRPVTTEAVIEGRSDDFYGGWGFCFVRRYLAENSEPSLGDDPMRGLEESMAGIYIPPGGVYDKLMVYDLNRICDNPAKGREVPVPQGENFDSLILHKVVAGGDPADSGDRELYPGCILVNVPRLKVHAQALFTNVIKNLGIGLYPMQVSRTEGCSWEYSTPNRKIPGMKGAIPHQVWIPEIDPETCLPKKAPDGNYIVKKTGGLTGTMIDIIAAVAAQDTFMVHIVDAIETVDRDHQGFGIGIKVPEGFAVAGIDPIATDLFCARYLFSNIGIKEAHHTDLDDGLGGFFPQAVPVPRFDGKAIITEKGYDSPISRDFCFKQGEKRGLGSRAYYVTGHDGITGKPLASFGGRLGYVDGGHFKEIVTDELYWDTYKMPWDLQKTFFAWLESVDAVEGSSLKRTFLEMFDETGDGIVTYEEYGKKGMYGANNILAGLYMSTRGDGNQSELFRSSYAMLSAITRYSNPEWNSEGHDFTLGLVFGTVGVIAQRMSCAPEEKEDSFVPGLIWGKGKWPSFSLAFDRYMKQVLYGWKYPDKVSLSSLYGNACAFADYLQNGGKFLGEKRGIPSPQAAQTYVEAVHGGKMAPLDFTFFVPPGYGSSDFPNIEETKDPAKVLTVDFESGKYLWPDVRTDDSRQMR
ncbi:MAG: DUF362 domain-containing protein [Syntrophales bacterium]|jgi:hypothetical protein|nr:DUF362 domain-containing protein [Syntrophales bacterium]MDY0044975.1 DUF362 domain-containing protein [Syntrophales bacterium]